VLRGSMTAKRRQKHGLKGLMAAISTRGLAAIDARSAGARALAEWKSSLERDLGGHEHLSEQQRTLIELATRTRLFLDSLDVYLMGLPSLVNKRKRAAIPALAQRMQLSDSLARLLMQLGIRRQEPPPPTLEQYLTSDEYKEKQAAQLAPPENDPVQESPEENPS
jgi:hypothetical protein